jgi:hypothetical protein
MNIVAVPALVMLCALSPLIAQAETPAPSASDLMIRHISVPLKNPSHRKPGQQNMSGAGCIGPNANANQTAMNPITGKAQAAPIVSIPVTGGNVATSTTHAAQSRACAHTH